MILSYVNQSAVVATWSGPRKSKGIASVDSRLSEDVKDGEAIYEEDLIEKVSQLTIFVLNLLTRQLVNKGWLWILESDHADHAISIIEDMAGPQRADKRPHRHG